MKPIRLSGHARENTGYRGATEQEVLEAIRTAPWTPAERGRLECRKDFACGQDWSRFASKTVSFTPQNRFDLSLRRRLMRSWL